MHAQRARSVVSLALLALTAAAAAALPCRPAGAAQLMAGAARSDITHDEAGPVNDRLYAKALALKDDGAAAVLVTVDAVAIGEIGPIGNDFLGRVRAEIEKELGVKPAAVLVNASHCHGATRPDAAERTVAAVKEAWRNMVPVTVGAGAGREDRIMENRRLKLNSGREADVRHAYAMPPDEEVAGVGPVDPEIGVLRLDRKDGRTLAVVYNFACHPIQGVPSGGNTADLTGFASRVIEDNLGGATAFFLQGCAGDVNPVLYKDVAHPRDAEPLGAMLGLSVLKASRKIECREGASLRLLRETVALPRADLAGRIESLQREREKLVDSLQGTSLNLKTFLELTARHRLSPEFPSYYSHRYLRDKELGREDWARLDAENRKNMEQYVRNVLVMEELTRLQANLALLKKHQAANSAAGMKTIDAEVLGLRVGDFALVTFPGELTVEIGLGIKKRSPHELTFVAAYTNGYVYYAPTAEQLKNVGGAQEDSDCLLAPEWQKLYEDRVAEMLKRL